ncbi:MAG: hypothetical protein HOQ20_05200 [Bradyrhizobium sp.]|nr:hypothetical protein [Bradyrhizobium sp.]
MHPAAAAAQTSGAVSIFSDDRLRGYTISDGRPVGILDLSYDDPSGFYGTVSGSAVASHDDGPRPLGLVLNGGYAKRLNSGVTIDAGVSHSDYSKYSDRSAARSYTEAYVGVSGKWLTGRFYASPDYLKGGTLYGELIATIPIADKLRLTGHGGFLVPLGRSHGAYSYRREVDWRIGVTRQFGPLSLEAAWTGVRPAQNLYRYGYHNHTALVLGLTYAL